MIGWAAAFLLPLLAALVIARRAAPPGERLAILAPLAGLALGLASVLAFALLAAGVHSRSVFVAVDAVTWIALAAIGLFGRSAGLSHRHRVSAIHPAESDRWFAMAAGIAVIATASIALVWFVASSSVYPHGEWDAWAQWNLRARFFFRGFSDGTWRNAFADVLAWSHADYPMLVPMSVARLWLYAGTDTLAAPIVFGGFMAGATVAAAALAIAHTRGAARACLAAAATLACPSFVRYSAAQCADVAVGFYLLCAFILWARADDAAGNRWSWILAGTAAALAGWTKNEGLAAFGIFLGAVAAERWWKTRAFRPAALVLAGAAPVLIVIVVFKLTLAPPSYFTSEQSFAQAVAALIDAGRLRLVGIALAQELWRTGASTIGTLPFLALFAIIRGVDANAPVAARLAIPAMLVLLVVYAAAYLVTPKDLAWQLQTSLDRLVLQVVPTLTWATLMLSR